jgi:glycine oxidase
MFLVILGMRAVDYIIVGQGLAGSCLALEFLKRKISFLVIDKPQPNTASQVAAGLFNPITGKTMQATWRANEIFSLLPAFYEQAEKETGKTFLHKLPIYRPFLAEGEQAKWQKNPHEFVSSVATQSQHSDFVYDNLGGLMLNNCGFLDAAGFLVALRQILAKHNVLREEEFAFEAFDSEATVYKTTRAQAVIFCDGVAANHNPFFRWVPIRKLKGEILRIKISLPTDIIFNRGVFAVPTQERDVFLVGSTYAHDASLGNTEAGVTEILSKARALFKNDFNVVSKHWGHRPTSPDRRPILGTHPIYKNLLFFNGLGTKGVSLAPFFAVQMVNYLEGKTQLESAVNIERFYSLYFQNQGEG